MEEPNAVGKSQSNEHDEPFVNVRKESDLDYVTDDPTNRNYISPEEWKVLFLFSLQV